MIACPACGAKNRIPNAASGIPQCGKCKAKLPWIIDADDSSFPADTTTPLLVLVDLWAPWCGPCRMVAPVLASLAQRFAGRIKVVKVNVDQNPRLAQQFNASSIPMLVFLKGGQSVDTMVGAHPEPALATRIEQLLR
ncbi:MAG: Thioredoxin [Actinomycetota bacterium]